MERSAQRGWNAPGGQSSAAGGAPSSMDAPPPTAAPAAWLAYLAWLEQEHPDTVLLLAEHAAAAAARLARAALAQGARERWTAPEAAERLPAPRPSRRTTLRWANEGKVRGWRNGRAPSDAWEEAARAAGGIGRKAGQS